MTTATRSFRSGFLPKTSCKRRFGDVLFFAWAKTLPPVPVSELYNSGLITHRFQELAVLLPLYTALRYSLSVGELTFGSVQAQDGLFEEVVPQNTPFEKAKPAERPGTESHGANGGLPRPPKPAGLPRGASGPKMAQVAFQRGVPYTWTPSSSPRAGAARRGSRPHLLC